MVVAVATLTPPCRATRSRNKCEHSLHELLELWQHSHSLWLWSFAFTSGLAICAMHKVRQLPFAGIWQIDIFSFSTAFYLPSQYFLLLSEKTLIKQKSVRIWGWRLKNWQCLLPFVHFSLSSLHLPPCHLLVFCFELRDFDGSTFFWAQHKSRLKSGLGNWEFQQQRWIHVLFLVWGFFFSVALCLSSYANYSVLFCAIHSNSTSSSSASFFFRFSCRVFYAGAILAT